MSVVCAALAVNAGAAERIPDACRLLSRAEIQGAIGGTDRFRARYDVP
jgi:hypothetical protein